MQLSLPVDVSVAEIERKASLGAAITLCCDLAGLSPKQACDKIRTDKAQFSRWESGAEGILWPKLEALMDACGNDVPVMWQLQRRGYDLAALRKRESALEAECRTLREERDALEACAAGGACLMLLPERRDPTEVLTPDDQATARESEFLAMALLNQQAQANAAGAVSTPGRCANCGATCLPRAVYCDADCRADHEARRLRLQRLKGR